VSKRQVPTWGGHDLLELIDVHATEGQVFRNRCSESNSHDRTFGGQILAQALTAAAYTVGAERAPTMMQFLFLQGALHGQAVDYTVTTLQDGKRFASRHVRGSQGPARIVLDAQVSFALETVAPEHGLPAPFDPDVDPARLPRFDQLPREWGDMAERVLSYSFVADKPSIDCRLPEVLPGMVLDAQRPRLRLWLRTTQRLGDARAQHAAAFAYLSDWWLNFSAPGSHMAELDREGQRLYVASLNHAIWLHRALRADEWLHFDCTSPAAAAGRGLTVAHVHDRAGRLVASVTQECLMAPR